ncbi:hypothetical protein F5Y19DRAFT_409872 [Xylariaceae sp. FL1651]|nr:hypothetical protein F5Y19DRAFT_409872 [Xylariaceae sp. FL1651]
MTDYTPLYPTNAVIEERVKQFISAFYAVSDDVSKNNEWVDYFTSDAILIIGGMTARGTQEIHELRKGMWEKIKSRKHKPDKVFPASFEPAAAHQPEPEWSFEYMLSGSLDLQMKTGEKAVAQWAGRAVLRETDGRLRYAFYQVYLHT